MHGQDMSGSRTHRAIDRLISWHEISASDILKNTPDNWHYRWFAMFPSRSNNGDLSIMAVSKVGILIQVS